jgi:hypothetical protein
MTRLFPICTDIVTPLILMVVLIIVAQIDRFTTKRTSSLRRLLLHPLHLLWPVLPLQPQMVTGSVCEAEICFKFSPGHHTLQILIPVRHPTSVLAGLLIGDQHTMY